MNKYEKEKNQHFLNEDAITSSEEDIFNFEPYAIKLQALIQKNSSNPNPLTIGIYGKWGEGKTSFMKLVEEQVDIYPKEKGNKGIMKYHFNPWRYSNEDEMLFDFFDGLSKIMKTKGANGAKIGDKIIRLSKYLKAVKISGSVGVPGLASVSGSFDTSLIFTAMGEDLKGKSPTIESLKEEVNDALFNAQYKVVVFIDDIDRLDKEEIYTILKLVKLNANFKNFVYLITIDKDYVAKAISKRYGKDKVDGYMFLEKIINVPIQLPRIEDKDFEKFFYQNIKIVFENIGFKVEEDRWNEIKEISPDFQRRFFKSPREIIRILNSFFVAAFGIGEEVNLRDLFWIETIKIQNENLYNEMKNYDITAGGFVRDTVIDLNDSIFERDEPNGTRKKWLDEFKESAHLIDLIFPIWHSKSDFKRAKAENLVQNSRINTTAHYSKYFTYNIANNVSSNIIKAIEKYSEIEDSKELINSLKELFNNQYEEQSLYFLQNLIKTLEEGNFFLFKIILQNLYILPKSDKRDIFGMNPEISTIELIANRIKKSDFVEEQIFKLANELDIFQLCYFTRKFEPDTPIRERLEKRIADLFKSEKDNIPFFEEAHHDSNSMILDILNEYEPEFLEQYLNKNLNSISNIKNLIRSFAPFWNGKFFGSLEKSNYDYLIKILDEDLIFKKIHKMDEQLANKIKIDHEISSREEATAMENLEQFVYWYKRNEAQQLS